MDTQCLCLPFAFIAFVVTGATLLSPAATMDPPSPRSRRERTKSKKGSPSGSGAMGFAVSSIGGRGTEIIFPVSTGRRGKHNIKVHPLNSEDDELVRRVLMKAGGGRSNGWVSSLRGEEQRHASYPARRAVVQGTDQRPNDIVDSTSCTSESSDASESRSSSASYSSSDERSTDGSPYGHPSDRVPIKSIRRYQLAGAGVRTRAAPEERTTPSSHRQPPWDDYSKGRYHGPAEATVREGPSHRQQPLLSATPKNVDGSGPGFFIRSGVVHAMWRDVVTPSAAGLVPPLQQQQSIVLLENNVKQAPAVALDAAVSTNGLSAGASSSHYQPAAHAHNKPHTSSTTTDVAVNTSFALRSPSHASNRSATADVAVNTSFGTRKSGSLSGANLLQASFDSIGNQRSAITSPSVRPLPAPAVQLPSSGTRSPPSAAMEGIPFVEETAPSTPRSASPMSQSPETVQQPQYTAIGGASPLSKLQAKSSCTLKSGSSQTPPRATSLHALSGLRSPRSDGIVMASSARSILLSPPEVPQYTLPPARQQSSPRMQEERPRVAWEQQQHAASSPDALRSPEGASSPGADGAMEEYVVPLGRTASSAKKDGNANPLRSYSHRSMFRPPREDVEAVRQLATSTSFVASNPAQRRSGTEGGVQGSPNNSAGWC